MSVKILPSTPNIPSIITPTPHQKNSSDFLRALQKAEDNTQQQNSQKEVQNKNATEEQTKKAQEVRQVQEITEKKLRDTFTENNQKKD